MTIIYSLILAKILKLELINFVLIGLITILIPVVIDVVNAIIGEARDFYIQIAKKRNNKKYLKGWLRRADYIYKA